VSEQTPTSGLQTGIYDLGYRSYDGVRLGRGYAVMSLFVYSLRAVFGLGRGWVSKLFPMGLAVLALVPAVVQLAVAAIAPDEFEFASPENYFGWVSIILALFCAVASPEVVGRDQRHHTLALYFSRALSRIDYVSAKLFALVAAMLFVLLAPQVILMLGNAVATDKVVDYLKDNVSDVPAIVASSLVVAVMMSSVSVAIASQTSKRAWATGAVIIYFVVATALGSILVETISSSDGDYAALISPFSVVEGSIYWIFNTAPEVDSDLHDLSINGVDYFLAAVGYSLVGLGFLYHRFWKMSI
jgi:ABC-2 type transport system permease protein